MIGGAASKNIPHTVHKGEQGKPTNKTLQNEKYTSSIISVDSTKQPPENKEHTHREVCDYSTVQDLYRGVWRLKSLG